MVLAAPALVLAARWAGTAGRRMGPVGGPFATSTVTGRVTVGRGATGGAGLRGIPASSAGSTGAGSRRAGRTVRGPAALAPRRAASEARRSPTRCGTSTCPWPGGSRSSLDRAAALAVACGRSGDRPATSRHRDHRQRGGGQDHHGPGPHPAPATGAGPADRSSCSPPTASSSPTVCSSSGGCSTARGSPRPTTTGRWRRPSMPSGRARPRSPFRSTRTHRYDIVPGEVQWIRRPRPPGGGGPDRAPGSARARPRAGRSTADPWSTWPSTSMPTSKPGSVGTPIDCWASGAGGRRPSPATSCGGSARCPTPRPIRWRPCSWSEINLVNLRDHVAPYPGRRRRDPREGRRPPGPPCPGRRSTDPYGTIRAVRVRSGSRAGPPRPG